jgi:hypothetical protein
MHEKMPGSPLLFSRSTRSRRPRLRLSTHHAILKARGVHTSRKWVARLMHELGISAAVKRTRKPTTSSDLQARFAPNTLKRDFAAELPNVKWVTDTNAVETAEGWLYVAAIFWGNSTKSAQNRLRDFRQAEVTYGYEYLGPLGNFARWGNRAPMSKPPRKSCSRLSSKIIMRFLNQNGLLRYMHSTAKNASSRRFRQ